MYKYAQHWLGEYQYKICRIHVYSNFQCFLTDCCKGHQFMIALQHRSFLHMRIQLLTCAMECVSRSLNTSGFLLILLIFRTHFRPMTIFLNRWWIWTSFSLCSLLAVLFSKSFTYVQHLLSSSLARSEGYTAL